MKDSTRQERELDYKLVIMLHQMVLLVTKSRRRELAEYNKVLTPRQRHIMFIIQTLGGKATPTDISRWTMLEIHTISELLGRMEKKQLINKVSPGRPGRNRSNTVSLTPKGLEFYQKTLKRESIHKILSPLSVEERQRLASYLWRLRAGALKEFGRENVLPFPFEL